MVLLTWNKSENSRDQSYLIILIIFLFLITAQHLTNQRYLYVITTLPNIKCRQNVGIQINIQRPSIEIPTTTQHQRWPSIPMMESELPPSLNILAVYYLLSYTTFGQMYTGSWSRQSVCYSCGFNDYHLIWTSRWIPVYVNQYK